MGKELLNKQKQLNKRKSEKLSSTEEKEKRYEGEFDNGMEKDKKDSEEMKLEIMRKE